MKKILTVLGCFLALTTTAFAAVTVTPEIDYNNEKITMKGMTDTFGGRVGIFMFHPDKAYSDIENGVFTENVMHFQEQITSDEKGVFSFEIPMKKGESKDYTYYIGAFGEERIDGVVKYYTKADMITAVNTINDAENASAVSSLFDSVGERMSFNEQFYSAVDKLKLATLVYNDAKSLAFDNTDINATVHRLNAILDVAAFTQGKATDISDVLGCFEILGEDVEKWYKSKIMSDSMKNTVVNAVKRDFESTADFNKAFTDSLILTITKNPSGVSNMQQLLSDFSGYLSLDGKYITNNSAKAVSGKTYTTTADLVAAVKASFPGNGSDNSGNLGNSGSSGNKNTGGMAVSVGTSANTVQQPEKLKIFDDLSTVQWAYEAIVALTQKGIVSGKTENSFAPNDNITREEFVKLLVSAMKLPLEGYSDVFADVKENDWFAPYVLTGYKHNLCNGYGDGIFGSRQNISRQDMSVMIMNVLKNKELKAENELTDFADYEEISGYAREAVKTLNKAGIITGQGENMFNPKGNATRAEAAVVIFRILEYLN